MNDAKFNLILPQDLLDRINACAKQKCISASALVRMALVEYLEAEKRAQV